MTSELAGLQILVLEDEPILRRQLVAHLDRLGLEASPAESVAVARKCISETSFALALIDVNLPDGKGTDLLKGGILPPDTAVVVMTAEGGIAAAVESMQLGAADYLAKPFDLLELPLVLRRALKTKQTARVEEHGRKQGPDFFFGDSLAVVERLLQKIIAADHRLENNLPPVLISGETGTGKTTIAKWIHENGPRKKAPFVDVNCSAIPDQLAESELFGNERGAFTDAKTARMGLFEAARDGTLFLDELPSLSLPLQAKVLKAIESQRIRRVGGTKEVIVDVRIIAAANTDLSKLVEQQLFRADLFHRLDVLRIVMPPLRDRGNDVLTLAEQTIQRLSKRHRVPLKEISIVGKQRVLGYRWPGNVRELQHELERAVIFDDNDTLDFPNLPVPEVPISETMQRMDGTWLNPAFAFPEQGFNLEEAIQLLVNRALAQTGENVSAAARLLGVSRDYVRYRMPAPQQNASSAQ